MQKKKLILVGFLLVTLQGCKWVDDFRERERPQYLELPPRATLNPDAKDYKGDDTHCDEDDAEMAAERDLPYIDEVSPIPEVPDHPAGI